MKRIFFKSILLCLLAMAGGKSFAYDCKVNGIYYNLAGDQAAVTSSPNKYSGSIVIPDVITFSNKNYKVTRIGVRAFVKCSNLKSVTIPKSVTFIWDNAFIGCANLEKLVVDTENKTYDSRNNCNAIIETSTNQLVVGCKETVIPSGVTRIGKSAFEGCEKLKSITIPEGVTSIADFAFADCPSLEEIIFPNSVDSLGNNVFQGSPWAKNYPNGVLYIGKIVYGYKGYMSEGTEIEIKEGATTIQPNAFFQRTGLSSVTLPNSLTSIGDGAFSGCVFLKRITFGDNLKDIGKKAFGFCLSLRDADLPNNLSNIGEDAFAYCVNLSNVSLGNDLIAIGPRSFYACQRLDSITLPNSVITIGYSAFEDCKRLKSVKMSNSVKDIGEAAFRFCESLLDINLSENINLIRKDTFHGCNSLAKLSIPNGLISIGESAFAGCKSLESIFVSKTVNNIGNMAFLGCSNLNQIEVDPENAIYDSRDNCNALILTAANILVVGSNSTVIPGDIEGIASFAFAGNTKLKSIIIPKGVKSIGNAVFLGCNGLEKIDVEAGNKTYDSRDNCNAIVNTSTNTLVYGCKATSIPASVVEVGDAAFAGISSMTSITIPGSVTKFGKAAFSGCNGLEKIVVEEGNSVYDSRNNCNAIIETASNTLVNGCKSTVIPESVTKIGRSAFYNFSDLTTLEIPKSVVSIEGNAFVGCDNCVFICNSETPATSDLLAFPKTICIVPNQYDKKYYDFQPGWVSLSYNCGFRLYNVTPTSVTLKTFPAFTDQWVEFEGKRYEPTDNMITIEGLTPNKHYSFETHATLNGTDYSYTIKAETK